MPGVLGTGNRSCVARPHQSPRSWEASAPAAKAEAEGLAYLGWQLSSRDSR